MTNPVEGGASCFRMHRFISGTALLLVVVPVLWLMVAALGIVVGSDGDWLAADWMLGGLFLTFWSVPVLLLIGLVVSLANRTCRHLWMRYASALALWSGGYALLRFVGLGSEG